MSSVIGSAYLDLLLNTKDIFWAGRWPPLGRMASDTALFDPLRDHRLQPDMHGRFGAVLLLEHDLARYKQWPLILDEALRLLRSDGALALRYGPSTLLTASALKHHLLAWTGGAAEPLFEHTSSDGQTQFGLRLTMPERPQPGLAGYSFALVSDGRRIAGVQSFIDSIRRLHGLERIDYEILICGPDSISDATPNWGADCRIVPDPTRFNDLGWITRKKNLCVEAAQHENLVIAHDRYALAADFLTEMAAFGADFDVLVCRQINPDGSRFPDWVTLGSAWSWTAPALLPYGEYCRHLFVNGGIMIAKRHTLCRVGWNELIFWGQAEDVELSRRFAAHGIVPRLARKVVAVSTAMRPGYMEDFESLPPAPGTYFLTQAAEARGETQAPYFRLGSEIALTASPEALCAQHGVRLGAGWQTGLAGALLDCAEGEIFLRLAKPPVDDIELLLDCTEPPERFALVGNGEPLQPWRDAARRLRACIPKSLLGKTMLRLYFRLADPATDFTLRSIELRPPVPTSFLALGDRLDFQVGGNGLALLAEGWSDAEEWGTWSIGTASVVHLPLPPAAGQDQGLEIEGMPFSLPEWPISILGLALNGTPFGHLRLDGQASFRVAIPAELLASGGPYRLAFHPQHAVSPTSIGYGVDQRELAFGLRHITYLGPRPA